MKKTILTSIIVFIGLLSLNQVAYAASAVLSVFPATASSTASSAFDVSVQINPTGNNVCVIKGTINFNNLTCQSITLANGLMAQTVPTCAAPNFTIGIPKCSAITQNLFSISVKGSAAGQAALSFSGVKVIGAGVDVASNLLPGTYNITAVPVKVPAKVVSTSTAPETLIPVESTETGLQVPRGVGELNPIKDIGENSSTTATSSISASSTATSTEEKKNGFVATALESLVNIPNKPMMALMLIALIAMGGLIFYNKKNNIDTPNISNTK